jgi:hypothetical protein
VTGFFYHRGDVDDLCRAINEARDHLAVDAVAVTHGCREDYERHGSPQSHAERLLGAIRHIHSGHTTTGEQSH